MLRQRILRMNTVLTRHYVWFVLLFVAIGLIGAPYLSGLVSINIPLFAFITFSSSLGGGFRSLLQAVRRPLPVLTVFVLLHLVVPLIALGLGNLLFADRPLFTLGLVLEYSIPTAVASLMWASLSGANLPLSLALVLLDTLLSPIVIPLTLRLFSGSVVEMDPLGMMWDLSLMVAIPALLAMLSFEWTHGRVAETVKPVLDPFGKIGLLIIVTANATGCVPFLKEMDASVLLLIAAVIALCFAGYGLGFAAGLLQKQPFPTTMTIALNAGMRNISAGSVLATRYFPADVLFPVAFSPIFLQAIAALVVRFMLASPPGKAWQEQQSQASAAQPPAP